MKIIDNEKVVKSRLELDFDKFSEKVKNKTYFELSDLNFFKQEKTFIYVLSKKNVGKTYQMMKAFKESVKNGYKFIFMRLSMKEIKASASVWNVEEDIPFMIAGDNQIYEKKYSKITKKLIKGNHVGFAISFKEIGSYGSMQFKGVNLLIFDEFFPQTEKIERDTFKPDLVQGWDRFVSNVERDKKHELKFIFFGNRNIPNTQFLTYYQIYHDTKIHYRENAKMFFIDTESLYTGIKGQKITMSLLTQNELKMKELLNNQPTTTYDRQINGDIFNYMKIKRFGLALDENNLNNVIYFKSHTESQKGEIKHIHAINGMAWIEDWVIYTPYLHFSLVKKNIVYKSDLNVFLKILKKLIVSEKLYFVNFNDLRLLQNHIVKIDDNIKWKG